MIFIVKAGVVILCLTLIVSLSVVFIIVSNNSTCASMHSPNMNDLINGLDSNFKFKSRYLRSMAESIYQYRSINNFKDMSDQYISLFMASNKISTPPPASTLNDITLYKLAIAHIDRFSVLISYIPIFNHARYVECVKAYDANTQKFNSIDSSTSTREIIIKQVFGIAAESSTDLSAAIDAFIKKTNPNYSSSSALDFIRKLLVESSDTALYGLLHNGFIGA